MKKCKLSKDKPRTLQIEIDQAPPSINGMYRFTNRGGYITKKGREFKNYFEWQLKSARVKSFGAARLRTDYEFHFKGKRLRDTSNYIKTVEDCLKGILFDDDEQIDYITAKRYYHCPETKIIITISEIV